MDTFVFYLYWKLQNWKSKLGAILGLQIIGCLRWLKLKSLSVTFQCCILQNSLIKAVFFYLLWISCEQDTKRQLQVTENIRQSPIMENFSPFLVNGNNFTSETTSFSVSHSCLSHWDLRANGSEVAYHATSLPIFIWSLNQKVWVRQ